MLRRNNDMNTPYRMKKTEIKALSDLALARAIKTREQAVEEADRAMLGGSIFTEGSEADFLFEQEFDRLCSDGPSDPGQMFEDYDDLVAELSRRHPEPAVLRKLNTRTQQ